MKQTPPALATVLLLLLLGAQNVYSTDAATPLMMRIRNQFDARAFYHLASRAGRAVDSNRSQAIMAYLREQPGKMDEVLKSWDIPYDDNAVLATKQQAWKKRFGDKALILASKHYLIMATDADGEFARLAGYYMDMLVAKGFDTMLGQPVEKHPRYAVYIYPDKDSFRNSGAPRLSLAYFSANRREFATYLRRKVLSEERLAPDLLKNMFHEAVHQAILFRFPRPILWLDEGLATQFESISVTRTDLDGVGTAVNEARLKRVKRDIDRDRTSPIRDLMTMDAAGFNRRARTHYGQVWSLVYFLRNGPLEYRSRFDKMLEALRDSIDSPQAVRQAFAGVNWSTMEADWKRYVKGLSARPAKYQLADGDTLRRYFEEQAVVAETDRSTANDVDLLRPGALTPVAANIQ